MNTYFSSQKKGCNNYYKAFKRHNNRTFATGALRLNLMINTLCPQPFNHFLSEFLCIFLFRSCANSNVCILPILYIVKDSYYLVI